MPGNKLQSYEELFGNLDYSSADEYRSVLSPAAYLTDIMDLKNWKYGDAKDAVDDRRDDISEILLNAENTITEIPHLDVVNQIMENRVARSGAVSDAYDVLKSAKFPFNLPFNRYKTEINLLLEYFKTDTHKFYRSFNASPSAQIEAREYLGLSAEEYQLITGKLLGDALKECYGLSSSETFEDLSYVLRFRKATELSALQVTELIFQNLSDSEKVEGKSKAFFINRSSSANDFLLVEADTVTKVERLLAGTLLASGSVSGGVPPANDYYDRIHRFIRLSRKTGLSFSDLDLILVKACSGVLDQDAVQIIAVIKWLQNTYEVSIEELCTLIASIKDYGKGDKTIADDLFDRLFNNGYDRKVNELAVGSVELKNRVQACLGCNESEYNTIADYLIRAGKPIEPTPARLALPYRIKKLATLFDIPVASLFTLFKLIDNNYQLLERAKLPLPIGFQQTIDKCRDIITIEESVGSVSAESVHNILWLVQLSAVLMQWLNDNEMSVEQLEFICTEHSGSTVEGVLSREETEDLLRDLDGQFRAVLFKVESLLTGITDKLTADILFEKLTDPESGVCTARGVIRATTTAAALLPLYRVAIREKLSIAADDLTKTGLAAEVLDELFRIMQNKDYIDLDEYISNADVNIAFFSDSANVANFLQETDPVSAAIIFKEISERVKSYFRANEAATSECASLAQKISVQAGRQQSVLFGVLESGLNVTSDIVKILCTTLFRTADETEQMATVRFMTPVMEAFVRETVTGKLVFDASLVTSFRRLLQFSLLVTKTELKARELDVLFYVQDIQKALPEKLKLTGSFLQKIDAMYSDTENNIFVFSGAQYLRFSGVDYALDSTGAISDLAEIPASFAAGINAALRDWAPAEADRKTYFFSGDRFANAASPNKVESVAKYWGKVRNHIAEDSRVDAAHRTADGKLYLFSDDQYVRYSGASRDYVDEGYPKSILRNWNNENQIRLPVEIRKNIDSIFLDSDGKIYFFSNDKFIDSAAPANVQKTKERWARLVNNIIDNNKVDDVLVKDGKTYIFSGDQYSRYSGSNYSLVDEGYPRKIANNWNNEGIKQLSGAYLERIDAAFNGSDNTVYLFNGNTYVSSGNNSAPAQINAKWGKVLNNIRLNNRVDATLVKDGKTYLFSGDQYFRYASPNYSITDEGYPKKIAVNWNSREGIGSLPEAFNASISAAFNAPDNTVYFFSGNQYIGSKTGAQPKQVKESWGVVRNNIQSENKIDAAFKAPDGKTYIFRGDQFYRYSSADYTVVDEGYPKKIRGNWGNLPEAFNAKIDTAFVFNVDGTDRLYLFNGVYFVRYSTTNFTQIDPGYPKNRNDKPNSEGSWFKPIYYGHPEEEEDDHHRDYTIATIFTDVLNNKARINFFYYGSDAKERLMRYEYDGRKYRWIDAGLVSQLKITPFTAIDAGFMGADNAVYLFAGNNFASMVGNYNGITTPKPVNGTWGKVLNRFQDLNRVDDAFIAVNGAVYLFCDTQYIKYSGNITPDTANFFVDESYPKTISSKWSAENSGIQLPALFAAQGYAVLAGTDGKIYAFAGSTFTSSVNQQPLPINDVWGVVENNFERLNRVDAGFVRNNKTYLFSANQYTRYSGDYSGYNDEGYPKKIAHIAAEDGIATAVQFADGIDAIMDGTDGTQYVFKGGKYVSSIDPSISADIKTRFGIVRNIIADSGLIDAADTNAAGVLYLFSGDQYVRYSAGSRTFADESYPKSLSNWKNFEQGAIPPSVTQGITASFTDADGEEYFFTQSDFFTLSNPALLPINAKWGKVKNNIQESGIVDAAFMAPNGKIYLFSQDQYVQYTTDAATYVAEGYPNTGEKTVYVDEGYPKKIAGNWGDLPDNYRAGIDAGFVFDGRTYFFKGATYIRYSDPACKKIDSGFPLTIASKMSALPEFRLNDVKTFQQFKALSKKFNNPDNSILTYLKDSKNGLAADIQLSRLSAVTAWPQLEITFLTQSAALSQTDIASIQALTEMNTLFGLSAGMGSLPSTINNEIWNKIYGVQTDLKAATTILAGQLKTVMGTAAWKGLAAELHNKMNLAKRDALLGYLIYKMEQVLDTNWIHNPRDLYEYLLIDVQMGEEATTSRIQEAIMCMQLFYQRTLMNLEDENQATMLDVRAKLKSWWIWMKNYRVWEANRKVFLYPENYIRPELRLDKSPEFKELEEALLQGDITVDTAEDAYKTYLEKYSVISRLKVAGGYVYQRNLGDPSDTSQTAAALNEKKIAMFGHSNTEPKKYYYMTGEILETNDTKTGKTIQTIDWAPWKEIGITIDADKVYPVFSFNRLFVFWVEVRERDQSSYKNSVGPDQKVTQYDPVIYYSFYNLKGEWTHPQKMFDIGKHVDTLPATQSDQRKLFTDDKKLTGTAYIPAKDVLNGARLYVTNPITSKYYNAEEFIYISYEVRYQGEKAYEFTFEGKVKSNLEFEQGQVDPNLIDKLEKNIQFPFEKFGITPVSFNHWKGFHNDAFSAPWFNFNGAGGSFLVKPDYVPDVPVIKKDKGLYKIDWSNLPDAGFTDRQNRQHFFYRDDLTAGAIQYYRVKDGATLSAPVPVTDVWGKRNILEWYPDDIASVAVNGDKTFIATDGNRYLSYTGPGLQYIDQVSAADTLIPFTLDQLLPSGATPELWHRVKEDLGDFLATLENAFVYSGDSRLYLVAKPVDENGQAVREYTIPDLSEFWGELAALVAESGVADILRTWTAVQSANLYTVGANKRLYIASADNVYMKDYIAGTNSIHSVAELTHPDLLATVYDATPAGAVETLWAGVAQSLMEFIARLSGVGNVGGSIRLIAKKQDNSAEFTVPVAVELFTALADNINDANLSPVVAALTELSAADLYSNGSLKRFYVRSGSTVVVFDYSTGAWSVKSVGELTHPDVTATVSSLAGLLPASPAVPWSDVAEDFKEYIATVQSALVWQGILYLLAPKAGGGVEYTTPTTAAWWSAVAEILPGVAGFQSVDAACVLSENGATRLVLTSASNVVTYAAGQWGLTSINAVWGLGFARLNGIMQAPDNKVYLFSGREYAEQQNTAYIAAPVTAKWGYQPNVITPMVDSAFMGGDGRVYLFTGANFVRYSDVDNKVIDLGYPKDILVELGIDVEEVKKVFSADTQNVKIESKDIATNTAFVQDVVKLSLTGTEIIEEKMYLFLVVKAEITRYVWKWRWRWWGGWNYRGIFINRAWWGWWWPEYYLEVQTETVSKSVYMRFSRNDSAPTTEVGYLMDVDYPRLITGNWSNLPGDFNKMITATFEDIEGTGNARKEIFYVVRGLVEQGANGSSVITNDYVKYSGKENFPKEVSEEIYEIIRLTSNTSEVLTQKLFMDGIDGLLSLDTQQTVELPRFIERKDTQADLINVNIGVGGQLLALRDNRKNDIVQYKPEYIRDVPGGDTLDFASTNAQYYWEIFFHAPFLIAQAFNNAQKFDEGNTWYEHIFDPTEQHSLVEKSFWKFLPFQTDIANGQTLDLNNSAQYSRYLNDPFDPHAIAGLRQVAYRKTIVMSYIDNLIDWGDMRFRQYTRESINEARMYYVLAYDLLGKKPELLGTRKLSDTQTYKQLRAANAALNTTLIALENLPGNAVIPFLGRAVSPNGSLLDPYGYFYIPENREFAGYWDRVEDRLYKIRYSLNIEGLKQLLPLFEPPLDVMALVRAVGSGMGLAQALANFNVAVPHYRFVFILGKARELNSRLTQFGQSFLSALEKKDAEELALLRNTHEKAILKLTLDIKNAQLQDSEETLKSLRANLQSAKQREAHYNSLISAGLSPFEQSQLGLLTATQVFTNLSQQFSVMSSVSGVIPEVGAFAFHWGGHNLAALFSGMSQSFNAISSNLSFSANLASILGGYHRRGQDWGLQQRLAQFDIESIGHQIAGGEIKVQIARLDIETTKTNIKNLESVDTFMKGKFTNLQLYRWMTGKLAGLYFQTYEMALDMAKWAEKSFQFELGYKESEVRFISSLYWDSLKKGLLAGETLQVDLDRMEKAYIEKNKRRFEISKTVSLLQLDPLALLNLREKRVCEFTFGEELFDYDFPGHYRRQIKTVSITFPAVAGPYENINATLTQLSHRTLIEPDKAGAEYLLKLDKGVQQPLSIRADWRTNQQIALSRGVNDAGLFQLNFQDERYLPFEGTGVVSTWRLELNGQEKAFDVNTLSDVVIKIEYSALQGGDVFAAAVKKLLKPTPAAKIFNLSQDFSAEWNSFMGNPSGGLKINVTREMFPNLGPKNKVSGLYLLYALSKEGVKAIGDTPMKLNTIDVKQATLINLTDIGKELLISSNGSSWKLQPATGAEEFKPEHISNIALVCVYEKKPDF